MATPAPSTNSPWHEIQDDVFVNTNHFGEFKKVGTTTIHLTAPYNAQELIKTYVYADQTARDAAFDALVTFVTPVE